MDDRRWRDSHTHPYINGNPYALTSPYSYTYDERRSVIYPNTYSDDGSTHTDAYGNSDGYINSYSNAYRSVPVPP